MKETQEQQSGSRSETSPWEWVVAAVSTLVVLSAIGVLLYEGIAGTSAPPKIEIAVETIEETANGYVVTFSAVNRGQTTAAALTVEGALKTGAATVEESSVTISYVPSEGRRQAGLFFSHDPRQYRMEIRPKGYDRP